MPTPPAARVSWLVAFVVLVAALHAVTTALVRPMFQVSDEIGYFALAQHVARREASDPIARERVMPDGRPFYNSPGGKPAFGAVAGAVLAAAAARHPSPDAAILTRLAFALCHVAVVLATWCMARRLYPARLEIAFVGAMFAAWQPVLVSFNAGVTPDAFANALSAWALYCVVRALTGRASWTPLVAATLLAAAAFAFKDTAFSVVAAVAWAALAWVRQRDAGRLRAIVGTGALFLVAVGAALVIRSPYMDEVLARLHGTRIDTLTLVRMLSLLAESLGPIFVSFWTAYGNFGAHEIFVTAAWPIAIATLCLVALAGLSGLRGDRTIERGPSAVWWSFGVGITAGLLLHPLRVVLLHGVDDFQGRWLFPMIAPMMLALALGLRRALATARATAATGALAAAAIGIVPLVLVVVPFFYASFPGQYHVANLYLQGVYGQGADPARAMTFVAPVSAWVVGARAIAFVATLLAALATVVVGATSRVGAVVTRE